MGCIYTKLRKSKSRHKVICVKEAKKKVQSAERKNNVQQLLSIENSEDAASALVNMAKVFYQQGTGSDSRSSSCNDDSELGQSCILEDYDSQDEIESDECENCKKYENYNGKGGDETLDNNSCVSNFLRQKPAYARECWTVQGTSDKKGTKKQLCARDNISNTEHCCASGKYKSNGHRTETHQDFSLPGCVTKEMENIKDVISRMKMNTCYPYNNCSCYEFLDQNREKCTALPSGTQCRANSLKGQDGVLPGCIEEIQNIKSVILAMQARTADVLNKNNGI